MDPFMLDGNAIGGLLQEVFGEDMTMAIGTCNACGAAGPLGATHVYRAAGVVIRCPRCDGVLGKIVQNGPRIWLDLRGIRTLEISVGRTSDAA